MPIKNSISILFSNFKLVYKLLLLMVIIVLIATAIVFAILGPVFEGYFEQVRNSMTANFEHNFQSMIAHPILTIQTILRMFTIYFTENSHFVNLRIIYSALIIIFARFLLSLSLVPVNKIMYSKMTTNFDEGLLNAFISTLPQSFFYSLITSIVLGIIDFALAFGLIYFAVWFIQAIGLLAFPITLALAITIYTLRITFLSQWLPEMAKSEDKNIFRSLKKSFTPLFKNFKKNFICMSVSIIIFVGLSLATLVPTFGLIPALLLPTFIVYYITLNITLNFSYYCQKYYTDNGVTIYNPTKLF